VRTKAREQDLRREARKSDESARRNDDKKERSPETALTHPLPPKAGFRQPNSEKACPKERRFAREKKRIVAKRARGEARGDMRCRRALGTARAAVERAAALCC